MPLVEVGNTIMASTSSKDFADMDAPRKSSFAGGIGYLLGGGVPQRIRSVRVGGALSIESRIQ